MNLIKIRDLDFTYPEQSNKALKQICLDIEAGEFVTLCGLSGSGKSTLLRQLKPALRPQGLTSGGIWFNGQKLQTCDDRQVAAEIGFVSQSPDNQIVTDKVWHELAFAMESLGTENAVIRQRVSEMAMFFGIQSWFHKNVSELSGGQKQILCLASVMTLLPKVILLDEPTSQLDPIAASDFINMLKKINKELGITIIITEHRLEEIIPSSDKVIIMDEGSILVSGTPAEVCLAIKNGNHGMKESLPVPVRVWSRVEDTHTTECPLDVNQGRHWLSDFVAKKENLQKNVMQGIEVQKTKQVEQPCSLALEAKNLYYRYEKKMPDVLTGTNISVQTGEILCVLGGNGTGKSTLLSVMGGMRKPQSGTVNTFGKRVGLLVQNPMTLFVKKTVRADLEDVCEDSDSFKNVTSLCKLTNILERHPYDLSGGEQQRLALAKVLLSNPDVLLLDEPTKGFDNEYKKEFLHILHNLKAQGKTVVIVSHDVEFCAEAADRCALFFDGTIVSQNPPDIFFAGNSFYTTAANRMSRGIMDGIITAQNLIDFCNNVKKNDINIDKEQWGTGKKQEVRAAENVSEVANEKQAEVNNQFIQTKAKQAVRKRNILAAVMVLLAIPFTLYAGVYILDDQKYLFISLLILLECMAPFILLFEGRSPAARELVMISVLCAICIAGRGLFYMLPEFKPVVALVVIAGASLGAETGFLVGAVTMLVSNMMFGQGAWTPWQMFALGLIGFFAGLLFNNKKWECNKYLLAIYGAAAAVVIYGGIMNPASALMSHTVLNKATILSYYALGLPLDLIRGAATLIFTLILAKPVIEKIHRAKKKYGIL